MGFLCNLSSFSVSQIFVFSSAFSSRPHFSYHVNSSISFPLVPFASQTPFSFYPSSLLTVHTHLFLSKVCLSLYLSLSILPSVLSLIGRLLPLFLCLFRSFSLLSLTIFLCFSTSLHSALFPCPFLLLRSHSSLPRRARLSGAPARPGPTHRRPHPGRGAERSRPAHRAGSAWCRLPVAALSGIAPRSRRPAREEMLSVPAKIPGRLRAFWLKRTRPLQRPLCTLRALRSPETPRAEGGRASLGACRARGCLGVLRASWGLGRGEGGG